MVDKLLKTGVWLLTVSSGSLLLSAFLIGAALLIGRDDHRETIISENLTRYGIRLAGWCLVLGSLGGILVLVALILGES